MLKLCPIWFIAFATPATPPSPLPPLIVPFAASLIVGPNVAPLSLLTFITGSFIVWLRSHHDTYTLFPSATIHALSERASDVLLKLIVASSNVSPLLVLLDQNTSQFQPVCFHEKT